MKKSIKEMSIDQIINLTTKKDIEYNKMICKKIQKKPKGREFI